LRKLLEITLAVIFTAGAAVAVPPDEAIERAIDRQKGRLYAAYAKALRQQPRLQGRIDLQFTVEKDGRASGCRVLHSELDSAQLEHKLCQTVEAMMFDPRQAPSTVSKRFDFFPAG
jgi:TonB family protein